MIDVSKMPERGIVYALYKDRVVFKKYNSIEEVTVSEENLLELHCFDSKREYRYLDGDEVVIEDGDNLQDCYEETVVTLQNEDGSLDDSFDKRDRLEKRMKVGIVNYIEYDENDLLRICNYRLKEVE